MCSSEANRNSWQLDFGPEKVTVSTIVNRVQSHHCDMEVYTCVRFTYFTPCQLQPDLIFQTTIDYISCRGTARESYKIQELDFYQASIFEEMLHDKLFQVQKRN